MRKTKKIITRTILIILLACCSTSYADETLVEIKSEGWILIGTLNLPEAGGPLPLVILMHQFSSNRSVYANLAGALAEKGIASLRIDLRGHGDSTNKGGVSRDQLLTTWPDVVAAMKYVQKLKGVDPARIGTVSASYSGEAVAKAGREFEYAKANIALSTGTMQDDSLASLKDCQAHWWFVVAEDDRRSAERMEMADKAAPNSELTIFAVGGHGTRLLNSQPGLTGNIVDWFVKKLK